MNISSLKFVKHKSDTLDVLLHGSKGGMNYSLMQKIFDECVKQGHSVANFNFPYFERGDQNSSGDELLEELETLKFVLNKCNANKYKHIRLIGKSLGGIIASYYVKTLSNQEQSKYSVVVFGYIKGYTNLKNFNGDIYIIQGEKDSYGGIEVVKSDLKDAISKNINYFEIKNADHSYKNESKEPVFEDQAIEVLEKLKDDYKELYDRVGKRIGWNFSHLKTIEEGQGWDFYQKVIKKVKPNCKLLDIGTGGGERILKIAQDFASVYAIDHSQSMIDTAKKNLHETKLKDVEFKTMDSYKLDFPDNYFDIVTDRHCDFNPSEVFRVLRKGGYFFTQQVSEGDQINIKKAFGRGQSYGIKDGTLKNKYLKELEKLGFSKIEDFDYNSKVIYKTEEDYIFLLRHTPTIPGFGKKKGDFEILKKFIEENKTKDGIETNSKRFMIIAVK